MHWLVPFGRNKQFIGRDSLLQELFAKLNLEDLEDCQRVAIAGLGGVGKTQIALEAAFRIKNATPDCSVFWISATSTTSFENSVRDIGQALQIPGINEDKADVKSLVKRFLSQESVGRWLLIIDNADDIDMLYTRVNESSESSGSPALVDYLPFSRMGSILFTTRNQEAAVKQAGLNVIMVKEMSEGDSQKLLETSLINKSLIGGKDTTAKLLENLAHLPLAIKQAAAYINQKMISVSDYLGLYEADGEELIHLLSTEFEDQGRYRDVKNPIALTWLISFRQISSHDPLAEEYLCFMSCVAQQDIPRSLLPAATTKRKELEAIGTLKAYAFISEREGQDSYDIHRLVQIAMRNWLKTRGELNSGFGKALIQVAKVFPYPRHRNKATWTTYLPHAYYVLSFQVYSGDFEEPQRKLLSKLGECFYMSGKYVEAERIHRQELAICERVLGKEHRDTLSSMDNLAQVLRRQGRYIEAEQIQQQTLELDKKVLGPEHPDTLACMDGLARLLRKQGKYVEAERLHRQTLELDKKVLGPEDPGTLRSMDGLGLALWRQSKFVEAEQINRLTLEVRGNLYGPEHPATLTSINNLARALSSQGKYAEAELMHRQTLELDKKVLGPEHPDTLTSMNNLALVLAKQGKYIEAEQMDQRTLELRRTVLGPEHPDTLTSMNNLALVLAKQGKYVQAEQIHRQTLELDKKVLGPEHPDALTSMDNLAIVLAKQGKYVEAEQMHRQTLELDKKVLGPEHPDTLTSIDSLVLVLTKQGKYTEAEQMRASTGAQ